MRTSRRRAATLLLAAFLGVTGGAVTALLADDGRPPASADLSRPEPEGGKDRLGLGIPRVDLDCDGKTYVLVGFGDSENDFLDARADWPQMRYARTNKSCRTAYPQENGQTVDWVAYLPPFETMGEACEERMTAEHKNDFVTRMVEGKTSNVLCPCVMTVSSLPQIGEGREITTVGGMWTYQYQTLLAAAYPEEAVPRNGYFRTRTVEATRVLQVDFGLNPTGYTDVDTWNALRRKACGEFSF